MTRHTSVGKTIILCYLFSLSIIPMCFFAQSSSDLHYRPLGVSGFYDINDTSSISVIDRINDYTTMQNVLYLVHEIQDDANNRMHFEFHVAGGPNYDFDAESIGIVGAVSFKINLCNPKIPNASDILVNINRLRNLVEVTGFNLPTTTDAQIDTIAQTLRRYDSQFWWKRVSIGATVPFYEDGYYDNPHINYHDVYFFVGYDLGDVITLQLGINKDKTVLLAASVDLSTPLYSLAEDFKDMISRLLRIPSRNDGYWY